jgi:hypothetical protein
VNIILHIVRSFDTAQSVEASVGLDQEVAPTKKPWGRRAPENLGLGSMRLVLPGGALTQGADRRQLTIKGPVRVLLTIFPYVDNTNKRMYVICDIALEIRERVANLTIDYIVDVWCIYQIGSSMFEYFKQSRIRLEYMSEYRECLAIIKAHTICPFYQLFR